MSSIVQPPSLPGAYRRIDLPERYMILIAALFASIYFLLSFLSDGYVQHDEIAHYATSYSFWRDPSAILTSWSRPGFKIFFVVPSLFGMKAVHLVASLIAGGTVYTASLLAKEYGVQNRVLALVFCGFQPLFYQISFRTYAEILGALMIALMLLFYQRRRFVMTAILASYLVAIRQELVVLPLILGIFFLWRREWLAFVLLGWTPLLMNILGWLDTNDPFWFVHSYFAGGTNIGFSKPGFFHYVKMATPIFGTTICALTLVGLFGMLRESFHAWKLHVQQYHALYLCLLAVLLMNSVLASETFNISSGQGIWRHILTLSPVVAVFATMGFNLAWNASARLRVGAVLLMSIYAVAVWIFFSYDHNYYQFIKVPNYVGLLVLLGVVYTFLVANAVAFSTTNMALVTIALVAMHTIAVEKPLPLSAEDKTVQHIVAFYKEHDFDTRVTLSNHPVFNYMAGFVDRAASPTPSQTLKSIREAPPGAIIVWDSHYSYRSVWNHDVHLDSLLADNRLKPLGEFFSEDKWFSAIVFEKSDR